MAWGRCPTHGPIQDAKTAVYGEVVLVFCRCGLECAAYAPSGFLDHDEVKALGARQPREVLIPPDAPVPNGSIEDYHTGGGWYDLPNGQRVRGRAAALEAFGLDAPPPSDPAEE